MPRSAYPRLGFFPARMFETSVSRPLLRLAKIWNQPEVPEVQCKAGFGHKALRHARGRHPRRVLVSCSGFSGKGQRVYGLSYSSASNFPLKLGESTATLTRRFASLGLVGQQQWDHKPPFASILPFPSFSLPFRLSSFFFHISLPTLFLFLPFNSCSSLCRRVNNPTLWDFCVSMIGRADIEGSKSNVAMNAWLPQASYPCGNFSDSDFMPFFHALMF